MEVQEDFKQEEIVTVFRDLLSRGETDLIRAMMVEIYYPDLLNLCASSAKIRAFCDDYLYKMKAYHDFGVTQLKYADNWTDEYKHLFMKHIDRMKFSEAMWEVEDLLSEEDLQSRSISNLRKIAKKFGVKTTRLNKDQIVEKLLNEVPGHYLLEEVNKYPIMKGY